MIIEVLVAMSIITVSILVTMAVSQKSVFISRQSFHVSQATFLLEEGAEVVRILRDNDWTNISSLTIGVDYYPIFSAGTWTLSTDSSTIGIFTRKVVVSSVIRDDTTGDISGSGTLDNGTKLITTTVSWDEGGDTINKTLQFYIMNIFS